MDWWPGTSARERGRILLNAADIIRREHDRLARLEALDSGKPIGEAREDIDEVAYMYEYFGGWATKIDGDVQHLSRDAMFMVVEGADGRRRRHHAVELPDDDGVAEGRGGARGRVLLHPQARRSRRR